MAGVECGEFGETVELARNRSFALAEERRMFGY